MKPAAEHDNNRSDEQTGVNKKSLNGKIRTSLNRFSKAVEKVIKNAGKTTHALKRKLKKRLQKLKLNDTLDTEVETVPYTPSILGLNRLHDMNSMLNIVEYQSLPRWSGHFLRIEDQFPISMHIENIDIVYNPFAECSFQLKRQFFYNNRRPLTLYHGTKYKYVDSICRNNFNWRLSGTERGHRIGYGVNFTDKLHRALHFCDQNFPIKCVIIADVLVEKTLCGTPDMLVAPEPFDTAVSRDTFSYVKFNDSEFCPRYVVYVTNLD